MSNDWEVIQIFNITFNSTLMLYEHEVWYIFRNIAVNSNPSFVFPEDVRDDTDGPISDESWEGFFFYTPKLLPYTVHIYPSK